MQVFANNVWKQYILGEIIKYMELDRKGIKIHENRKNRICHRQ